MKIALLDYLVCPLCKGELTADLPEPEPDGEYMSGTLSCSPCAQQYQILAGIPRMVVISQEPGGPSETFGFEWLQHAEKRLEGQTVFGRTQAQDVAYFLEAINVGPEDLKGTVILDAGCGSGQLTKGLGELQAKTVIGVDVNTAIEAPFQRCRQLANVHIVNADINALPFRPQQFDLVWSNGVIHHLEDPPQAFTSLTTYVKPHGKLYVWVYERRWNPYRFIKDRLEPLGLRRVPRNILLYFCKLISIPSFMLHSIYRLIRRIPGLQPVSFADQNTTRYRTVKEFELTWFDALSPKYDRRYTEAEVTEWFRAHGFQDLKYYKQKVGVCGIQR